MGDTVAPRPGMLEEAGVVQTTRWTTVMASPIGRRQM